MDKLLDLFENLSSAQKFGWIFICLLFSWFLEFGIPLSSMVYDKWKHAGRNFVFLLTSILINLIFGIATVGIFLWIDKEGFGLLNLTFLNPWIELLIAVMALDFFAQWIAHYLLHKIKWMWKFHLVHHSDLYVDATSGTRHHPGDYLIRELFSLATVIVFGIPLAFYLFYRIATIFFTYFTHANIALPLWLDKGISFIFVSPNMHKFHHHFERPWTNTNFGNIFSIWDRVLGTFVYDDPRKIHYGIDVLSDANADKVGYQMMVPFDSTIKTDY